MKVEIIRNTKEKYTRVFIDGQEIHRVISYEFTESITERPILKLELGVEEIELAVDGAEVEIKTLKDKRNEEGYKDFIRFLFRGKCGIDGE